MYLTMDNKYLNSNFAAVSPGVYDISTKWWYSPITNKCYSTEKECDNDIRKLKLEKLQNLKK
jgi:hypothetical protein